MKKLILLLAVISAFMWSCSDDAVLGGDSIEQITGENNAERIAAEQTYLGVYNNGQWLVFSNQKYYSMHHSNLLKQIDAYEEPIKEIETDQFIDPNPVLAKFEAGLKHTSLRLTLEKSEHVQLERGGEPIRILNALDNKGVSSEVISAFFNPQGIVQVGKDIYYMPTQGIRIKISNANTAALSAIIKNGVLEAYNPRYVRDVEVEYATIATSSGTVVNADCDATFSMMGANYNETTEKYDATFVWSQNSHLGDFTDLSLNWTFGDGSSTSDTDGNVSHAYSQPGTYIVCLTISGTLGTGDDAQSCSTEYCKSIEIEEEFTFDLCDAVAALNILDDDAVGNMLFNAASQPGNPAVTCVSASGLVSFIANIEDVPQDQFEWNIAGQQYTGSLFCFDSPCDADYVGTLKIGDCATINFEVSVSNNTLACLDGDYSTQWYETQYQGGERKITYQLETKSKENNWWIFGNNKVVAKMKHYRKKSNGNWKKKKADLDITSSGNVYADGACDCDAPVTVNASKSKNNKKTLCAEQKFNSYDGISLKTDDVWEATFKANNAVSVTQPAWP